MDYLTRLRLSKLLDADDKWAKLAEQLGCQNMVEFIRICADENSSPTMILLDQYEVRKTSSFPNNSYTQNLISASAKRQPHDSRKKPRRNG